MIFDAVSFDFIRRLSTLGTQILISLCVLKKCRRSSTVVCEGDFLKLHFYEEEVSILEGLRTRGRKTEHGQLMSFELQFLQDV